jgi:probable HAF family extracellular repeat protein
VNNSGAVSGFFVDNKGMTHGFLLIGSTETTLDFPGSQSTQALGLNNDGQVVGEYTDGSGNMHGFLYTIATGTHTEINDPLGVNTTTINGINDSSALVGFYVDTVGNTDGFVATATPVATPEPATGALIPLGLGIVFLMRKRIGQRLPQAS